jgi:DNA-directed RNA polymerase specialized sigma24 family protein
LHHTAASDADSDWSAAFTAHVVRVAIERIRPNFDTVNWRAFELTWIEDCPPAEAAAKLEIPPSRVYVAKARILKRLREEVQLLAEDIPTLSSPHEDQP